MNKKLRDDFAALLRETEQAHKSAAAAGGADPDWPIWYADYARDRIAERLGLEFTRSQLIYCLMQADIEHQARAPDSEWSGFYAGEIIEHCGPPELPAENRFSLYHYDSCPFCAMVRRAIGELGINVELRNVREDPQHLEDLLQARGRATVPVLRIQSTDGEDRWMPESRDIIAYLQRTRAGTA